MKPVSLFFFLLLLLPLTGHTQDTLVLKNGDVIAGEVKVMNQGVIKVETDYSNKDFEIEWDGVVSIHTLTTFLITTSEGVRHLGRIETGKDGKTRIMMGYNRQEEVALNDIVELQPVKQTFLSRLFGNLGVGFSMTKANHFRQLDINFNAGYRAKKWILNGALDMLYSRQDSVNNINKFNGDLSFNYYLPHDWFTITDFTFFSSTEQRIHLRTNGNLGVGYYLIHTNAAFWGLGGGLSFNNEQYYDQAENKQSMEGLIKMNVNLFDVGDLSLNSRLAFFPGITEWGRIRSTFELKVKYDLPLDFYISLGGSYNFDNRPVAGASRNDYSLQTGFGWKW